MIEPIVPMEPTTSFHIPKNNEWVAQVKWDGVHVLTYFFNHETRLFNRKKRERTDHYPELLDVKSYCSAESVIFDGEIIALADDGKPSFHRVLKRDGIRNLERVPYVQKQVPITYMVYDVVFYNGEWLTNRPLHERIDLLSHIVTANHNVHLVSSHDDGSALFKAIAQQDMEGIVMKQVNSLYYIGEKKDVWRKIKYIRDLIAVVGGFTLRNGIVNAVLLGLYNEKKELFYIGHSGTGKLPSTDWRQLTNRLLPLEIKDKPFVNGVKRSTGVHWVRPTITMKIHYAEWPEGGSLRQPSIQAIVDVPASECVFSNEMER